jgi:hypothetical protein
MANKELTEMRVRNVMRHIPKSAILKRESKVRNTLRETLSSMKTIISKLKHGKTEKYKAEKVRQKKIVVSIAVVTAIILMIIVLVVILRKH